SRSRRCATSPSTEVMAVLRRFGCMALRGLIRGRCTFAFLDVIDPAVIRFLRNEIEAKLLADDASKKAADRMMLPLGRGHHGRDRRARWGTQHRDDAGVLCVRSTLCI